MFLIKRKELPGWVMIEKKRKKMLNEINKILVLLMNLFGRGG